MAHVNTVVLSGNIVRDGELKQVGQSTVLNFSIAVNRWWQENGEWKQDAGFFDCEMWGQGASRAAERIFKGNHATLQGSLKHSTWKDRNTGANRSKVTVLVRSLDAPKRPDGSGPVQGAPAPRFDSEEAPTPGAIPQRGQHCEEILKSAGVSADEITAWRDVEAIE